MNEPARSRYPGYDVLAKRDTPSWDDATRAVIEKRLAQPNAPRFCTDTEWRALCALAAVIVPQSLDESVDAEQRRFAPPRVPVAGLVDTKLADDARDGYRDARLPPLREAWRTGLAAIDEESRARHHAAFADLSEDAQRDLLSRMQRGELDHPSWRDMPCDVFFSLRLLHDIGSAYYSHPHAWSEIGFGGPANPRGYVRMQANRRDPWEAVEARPGREAQAAKGNARAR
ncbi:gluconate 2-dehydrogenase [Trinickia symbiotica]|uniref:Gluconate 2-dehydrogenase n=1 Tax=Trinickia symbiotica TaxID=863227 RepID=A0A2T3Y149_9BURK|nr:gluconate 2-dehydrogenase subunit 3 family protein [Trinickia symbiotica]PTB22493.1 gluconate 2-dehydrogenase [Trinickia symbiotica]